MQWHKREQPGPEVGSIRSATTPQHRFITSWLYDWLSARLPKGYSVWKEELLSFLDSEPEPEISVTRGSKLDFARVHPSSAELVVEVSVSSPALDRANAALYAEAGVRDYWIVLGAELRVEVYRCPERGVYQECMTYGPDDRLEWPAVPGTGVRVGDLFVTR